MGNNCSASTTSMSPGLYCDALGHAALRRKDYRAESSRWPLSATAQSPIRRVLELTYNWGKSQYELGDRGHIFLASATSTRPARPPAKGCEDRCEPGR